MLEEVRGQREASEFANYTYRLLCKDGSQKHIEQYTRQTTLRGKPAYLVWSIDRTERKHALDQLRRSEELLSETSRLVLVGGWEYDLATGAVWHTDEVSRIHGLPGGTQMSLEDALGFYEPKSRERLRQLLDNCIHHGAPYDEEFDFKDGSGRLLRVRAIGQPVRQNGRITRLRGIFHDVSEARRAERELAASEQRFRSIIDASPFGVHLYELTRENDLVLRGTNKAAEVMLGVRHDHGRATLLPEAFPSLATPEIRTELVRTAREGGQQAFESLNFRDEHILNIYDITAFQAQPGIIAVVFAEITQRIHQERALRKSEALLAETQQLMKVGGWEYNAASRRMAWTAEVYRIHGIQPADVTDHLQTSLEQFPEPHRREVAKAFFSMLRTGEPFDIEAPFESTRGKHLWVRVSGRAEVRNGTVLRAKGTFADITERRLADDQLRQAQKLASLGTLAGGIAHDFNNILFAIMGNAEMAQEVVGQDSRAQRNLREVITAASRASELIKQILAFARPSSQPRSPLMLQTIAKEVLKLVRATMPTNITIDSDFAATGGWVLADSTEIHQVLLNLCTNAGQAMLENGGTLTVRISQQSSGTPLRARQAELPPGDYVRLEVEDTGHGMALDVIERIFEPFFTTRVIGQGTGMGLAVVHGLVTGLGGAVDVQSTTGEGSRFTVYLPAVPGQEDEAAGEQEELPRGSGRVMLVDDEDPLVQMLTAMLANLGYEPLAFNSSEDALACLEGDPHCCDLLLSDMTMPGLSGQYLARRARELRPDLPVVLMTGYSQTLSPEDAFKQGINAYLFKPITRQELARTLGALLDTRQATGKEPAGQV